MNLITSRLASFGTPAAAALALAACTVTSSSPDPGTTSSSEQSLLVGTWTYSGSVPDIVTVHVTFDADKTFTFVETILPSTTPAPTIDSDAGNQAGYVGCVVSDSYQGTYETTDSAGASTLTMTFANGTANTVTGCASASDDSKGVAMGQDAIDSYRDQGLIPARTESYDATPTTLVLTPPKAAATGGFSTSTKTLTKAP